jgi:hypothetical protein
LAELALPGAYAPASIVLRVSGARKLPLLDKVIVVEEKFSPLRPNILLSPLFSNMIIRETNPKTYKTADRMMVLCKLLLIFTFLSSRREDGRF